MGTTELLFVLERERGIALGNKIRLLERRVSKTWPIICWIMWNVELACCKRSGNYIQIYL